MGFAVQQIDFCSICATIIRHQHWNNMQFPEMPDVFLAIPKTKGGSVSAKSEPLSSDVHRRSKWETTEVWPIGIAISSTYIGSVFRGI